MIKNKSIPTINISSIVKKSSESKKNNKIIKKIENACIDVCFFQITGHGISLKKLETYVKLERLFLNK